MRKKIFLTGLFLLFSLFTTAQVYNPVKWKMSVEKISDTEYELKMNAKIQETWHLYSQNVPDGGPLPTHFTFEKSANYKVIGEVIEEGGKIINDPVFKLQIKFFEKETTFKQRIKSVGKKPFEIKGELEFMVCNDQSCLPPTYENILFSINPTIAGNSKEENSKTQLEPVFVDPVSKKVVDETAAIQKTQIKKEKLAVLAEKQNSGSLWSIFLLSLLSGFAALF